MVEELRDDLGSCRSGAGALGSSGLVVGAVKWLGLAPYGEYWRQVRKISTLELFTVKRVESFRFIREEETLNMLKAIRKEAGCAVNLSNKFFVLACDVMCRYELLGGGSENSSATLEWTMSELLKNPRVMEKAQAEVRRVYEESGVVDETKLQELKYLKHVVREALTRVVINAWAIRRDPECWTDPEQFSPERFENCLVDYKGNNFELIPFGAGRRRCPG
uniref:Uncharacterized protein n=1 Tax=Chenopodium quinoa TaxID=63459 RepID=A0A803MFA1_CHEQI